MEKQKIRKTRKFKIKIVNQEKDNDEILSGELNSGLKLKIRGSFSNFKFWGYFGNFDHSKIFL